MRTTQVVTYGPRRRRGYAVPAEPGACNSSGQFHNGVRQWRPARRRRTPLPPRYPSERPSARHVDRGQHQHRRGVQGVDPCTRPEYCRQRGEGGQRGLGQVPSTEQPRHPARPPAWHPARSQQDRRTGRQHQCRPVADAGQLERPAAGRRGRPRRRPSLPARKAPMTTAPARNPEDTRACCEIHSCGLRRWDPAHLQPKLAATARPRSAQHRLLATPRRAGPFPGRCSRCSRCSRLGRRTNRRTRPTAASPQA